MHSRGDGERDGVIRCSAVMVWISSSGDGDGDANGEGIVNVMLLER